MIKRLLRIVRVVSGLVILTITAYCGIFIGIVPVTLIVPLISKKLAYKLNDQIMTKWFQMAEIVLTFVIGIKMRVFGDKLDSDRFIMIANHRCRLDWFFTMALGEKSYHMKYSMKDPLRHIPFFGWAMQFNFFIFLKRNISIDRERIYRVLHTILEMGSGENFMMFFFPEGTDLSPNNKERNLKYAEKNSKKPTEFVLLPRINGFKEILKTLHQSKKMPEVIYDLTIGYPGRIAQSELDLLSGNYPQEVHFHFKGYPYRNLSFVNGNDLNPEKAGEWLEEIWYKKDDLLKEYYGKKSRFFRDEHQITDSGYQQETNLPNAKGCRMLLFWAMIIGTFGWSFSHSFLFKCYAFIGPIVFTLIDIKFKDGVSGLYAKIYGIKDRE